MFQNYLRIAYRNLLRRKTFSLINIVGLSIGLACCLLIALYTKDELSYDRFHANRDNLFRLTCEVREQQNQGIVRKMGIASMIQGPAFKEGIPEIQEFVRIRERESLVKFGANTFNNKVSWVDSNFFSVFSFPLLSGDPNTVLSDFHSIVVSEEAAQKYFGTTNAVGKFLEIDLRGKLETFVVTGVAKNPPQNSSVKFSLLVPFGYFEKLDPDPNWLMLSYSSYLLLRPNANVEEITKAMQRIYSAKAEREIANERKHGWQGSFTWGMQPIADIHLASHFQPEGTSDLSNPLYSSVLAGIALAILLIACINFVNLTIAQTLRRSKEIGIRKVVGGRRSQLFWQFLTESFLQTGIAFALAVGIAELVLPAFNEVANKHLSLSYLLDATLVFAFFGLYVLTALGSGIYPALLISGFKPAQTLFQRSQFVQKGAVGKGLVIVQFALTTSLFIGTLVVYRQFDFLTTKNLGYNDKNLLVLNVPQGENLARMSVFKSEFSKAMGVISVAPRTDIQFGTIAKANGKEVEIVYEHIDHDFIPTMGVELAKGRNFSADLPSDSNNTVLVNEAFVRSVGWTEPIGKTIDFLNGRQRTITIAGVIKDYHFESLKGVIKPQVFIYGSELPFGQFLLRVSPQNVSRTIASVEKIYRELVPLHPFEYRFQDDVNYNTYKLEAHWKSIITIASVFTFVISVIGLLGLTLLATEQRTKEIGIRKVLGASVASIIGLLSKDFLKLVVVAIVIATPLAYWAAVKWLQDFAFRIDLGVSVFVLAGALAILIAFATVASQAWRAARANPVNALRSE